MWTRSRSVIAMRFRSDKKLEVHPTRSSLMLISLILQSRQSRATLGESVATSMHSAPVIIFLLHAYSAIPTKIVIA